MLGRALMDDLCSKQMNGCCCNKIILGLWKRALPTAVKQAISQYEFNHTNFEEVFKAADNAYRSTRPTQSVAAVAAVSKPNVLDEGFHQGWRSDPAAEAELAALTGSRGRGGRGRGQRGGRQNWNNNSSGTGRGGSGGQNGNQSGGQGSGRGGSQAHPRHKTPRHADKPPVQSCFRHWTYGKSAHFCQEPSSCPWKEFWIPKSNNQ